MLKGVRVLSDDDDGALNEINRNRRVLGLSKVIVKMRECLKCRKEFKSQCFANRLCQSCVVMNERHV